MLKFREVHIVSKKWAIGIVPKDNSLPIIVFLDLSQTIDKVCGVTCQITTGQYNFETLWNGDYTNGLDLDGGVDSWKVEPVEMDVVRRLLEAEKIKWRFELI